MPRGERPKRIQRKRTKGYRLPSNAVYVGRPSRWGNPFIIGQHVIDAVDAVEQYEAWLKCNFDLDAVERFYGPDGQAVRAWFEDARRDIIASIPLLRGKDLCCWCPLDQPCHADILLELASRTQDGGTDAEG